MPLERKVGLAIVIAFILTCFGHSDLEKTLNLLLLVIDVAFIIMLVFMVTKDDYDRYGIWKTFIGTKQPSMTQMLEFGKWAVFRPVGILMQATIIDFNTEDDTLESSEPIEISSQYASANTALVNTAVSSIPDALSSNGGPPAPPPPPPAPPLPQCCHKISMDNDDDEFKCKRVNWKELNISLKNTIWDRVNQNIAKGRPVVDANEILEVFREKPKKLRKFSGHSLNFTGNKQNVLTITGKKQLNISIALAHHQLYAEDLIDALKNVDVTLLEADFLNTIENFLPDQNEETSLIQKYSSRTLNTKEEILSDPEEFSFLISSVPDFRKRIRAMVFQCSFQDRVNAICKNFEVIKQAVKEIKKSEKLEKVLLYILSIGKIMNSTSAKAFNIDFLPTASRLKTSDGDSNLLMYTVSKIKSTEPEMLSLSDELQTLDRAVKVSLNDIDKDCTELAVEYSSVALELELIAAESETFNKFLRQGKLDLNNIKRKRRTLQQELTDLIEYFGIDPIKTKPTEIFDIMKQFLKDLQTATTGLAKIASERKTSTQSMMRSSSTPNFRKSSRNSSAKGSRNSSLRGSRNSSAKSSRNSSFRKSRSGRTISVNSNCSVIPNRERDISSLDDSGITLRSRVLDNYEDTPTKHVEISKDIKRNGCVGSENEINHDSSYSTMSSVSSQKSTSQCESDEIIDLAHLKRLETRKKNPKSYFRSKSIDDVLDMVKTEENTAMEELRKILSPVKEKPDKCQKVSEVENELGKLVNTAEEYDNCVEERFNGNNSDNKSEQEHVVLAKANKTSSKRISCEENKAKSGERLRKIEDNLIRNQPHKVTNDKRLYNIVKIDNKKSSLEKLNSERCKFASMHPQVNDDSRVTYENEQSSKSDGFKVVGNAERSSFPAENELKSSPQKNIKVSWFTRKSSLRGSNRRPKRVGIKAVQIKDLQKAKKLSVQKSEPSLMNSRLANQQTMSNGIQSFVLKEGYIEKCSPSKYKIKDIGSETEHSDKKKADSNKTIDNNNNIKAYNSIDNGRLHDSNQSDELYATKEQKFRRTKSAVLVRNSRKPNIVISNYTIV